MNRGIGVVQRWSGVIALFLVVTGGTAYALDGVNTVFTDDITNGEVKGPDIGDGQVGSVDVRDGQLTGTDVRDGTIGRADVSGLAFGEGELFRGGAVDLLFCEDDLPYGCYGRATVLSIPGVGDLIADYDSGFSAGTRFDFTNHSGAPLQWAETITGDSGTVADGATVNVAFNDTVGPLLTDVVVSRAGGPDGRVMATLSGSLARPGQNLVATGQAVVSYPRSRGPARAGRGRPGGSPAAAPPPASRRGGSRGGRGLERS